MIMAKELLNQSQLADRFDLDRITVRTRLREAGIVGKRGKHREILYDPAEVADVLQPQADADYERERALKTRIERETKELDLRERRGELVERREIQNDLQQIFAKLYQKTVNQLPRELSGALYRAESPEHCQAVLQKSLAQIFTELREEHESLLK